MKHVNDEPWILSPGHAWLEYRWQQGAITFSKTDLVYLDRERGLCGEAVRERALTHAEGGTFLTLVCRRAATAIRRGFMPEQDPLNSARFAALMWRAVTGERIGSRQRGFFNVSTLAAAIERLNARDRFLGVSLQKPRRIKPRPKRRAMGHEYEQ
jgi:hypothetical protein